MITAVDSSVLLDVFGADPSFGPGSAKALRSCLADGALVACEVVWAEVSAAFAAPGEAQDAMSRLGVRFEPMGEEAAIGAGSSWRSYRKAGGTRDRVIADFLIAAHARARADRLLTRDRGFTRTYFGDLEIVDATGA